MTIVFSLDRVVSSSRHRLVFADRTRDANASMNPGSDFQLLTRPSDGTLQIEPWCALGELRLKVDVMQFAGEDPGI